MSKSNKQKSIENAATLSAYVDRKILGSESVPMRNGSLCLASIYREAFGHYSAKRAPEWFWKNDDIRDALQRLAEAVGAGELPAAGASERADKQVRLLENRVSQLETQVASLQTENEDLRRNLRQRNIAVDHLESTGRTLW